MFGWTHEKFSGQAKQQHKRADLALRPDKINHLESWLLLRTAYPVRISRVIVHMVGEMRKMCCDDVTRFILASGFTFRCFLYSASLRYALALRRWLNGRILPLPTVPPSSSNGWRVVSLIVELVGFFLSYWIILVVLYAVIDIQDHPYKPCWFAVLSHTRKSAGSLSLFGDLRCAGGHPVATVWLWILSLVPHNRWIVLCFPCWPVL